MMNILDSPPGCLVMVMVMVMVLLLCYKMQDQPDQEADVEDGLCQPVDAIGVLSRFGQETLHHDEQEGTDSKRHRGHEDVCSYQSVSVLSGDSVLNEWIW